MSGSRTFIEILNQHFQRYPAMQIQDVYKLIHQATLGSEHAVRDSNQAWERLEREMTTLGSGPEEPMIDPLSVEGDIVRVHLRPFLNSQGNPTALLQAFIRTANEFHGSVNKLRAYWEILEGMARKGLINLPLGELQLFFDHADGSGFPAMHHSDGYTKLYQPAYRVVAQAFLQNVFPEA